jgi:predicted heme/steroid binding protein
MKKRLSTAYFLFILTFLFLPFSSFATPEYAQQTGKECIECHKEAVGGAQLTPAGEKFAEDMRLKGLYRPLTKVQKAVRFLVGYIHLITAIAWFGTIFYVHLLLKPAYAAKGLPKGELFLGWVSIIIMAVTGTLLTIARLPSWRLLYTTRFGILLSTKIILFLIMVSTAVVVTFIIGPRLRKKMQEKLEVEISEAKHDLTADELQHYDGKEGRPGFVAYQGKIYNMTRSKLWKGGLHMKHLAGQDLTDALKSAPHGEGEIMAMPLVGDLIEEKAKVGKTLPVRVFYVFAYLNLLFVFLITFIIALWRWW